MRAIAALIAIALVGCASNTPPKAPASPAITTTTAAAPPIEPAAVTAATGSAQVDKSPDGIVKASFPRKDVDVAVSGFKMAPFMGLTSWVGFSPGKPGVAETMIMGDLVVFEDEVNPVMSALLEGGVSVTALHNHFFYAQPSVFFMHVGGEGTVAGLGGAVKNALAKAAAIRKDAPKPATSFTGPAIPEKSAIDGAKLEAVLGVKGQAKDGMFKVTIGRKASASCGCNVGKSMGVNTWAAFAGSDDNAIVDGDFAVTEDELQKVLKSLRSSGVNIVAIHHHMTGETPRVLFLHYWGSGKAADLAAAVRKALDLTASDKSA
jgi:hypothetical protein